MKLVLSLSLLSFLLSTFSYRAALLAFTLIGLLFLVGIFKKNVKFSISRKVVFLIILLNIMTILLSLNQEIYLLYYIKMTAMMFYLLMLHALLTSKIFTKDDLVYCFKVVVLVNSACFLAQFSVYELTGYLIDFNAFIREKEAHTIYGSRSLEDFIIGIRATGLYSEPSFYAMSVFPTAITISLYEKRMGKTLIVALITCLLSLSIAAIAIVLLSLLVYYKVTKSNRFLMLIILTCLLITLPFLYEFIISRLYDNADYDAIGLRLAILDEFDARTLANDIFGSGYFWDENKPIGNIGLTGARIRDSSFYVYTYFSGGVMGLLILLLSILFLLPKNWKIKYVFCTSLLFKLGVLVSAFWFFIGVILILNFEPEALQNDK